MSDRIMIVFFYGFVLTLIGLLGYAIYDRFASENITLVKTKWSCTAFDKVMMRSGKTMHLQNRCVQYTRATP